MGILSTFTPQGCGHESNGVTWTGPALKMALRQEIQQPGCDRLAYKIFSHLTKGNVVQSNVVQTCGIELWNFSR
jgi:hypothetical protein